MLSPSAPQRLPDSSLPQVFHAAGGASFAASVVAYIARNYSPQEWPQIHVFLPNRRSVTALRDAFLDALEAKTALLPVMIPLADIDPQRLLLMQGIRSDVPPIPLMHPARRLMLLARQVEAFMRAHGENCTVRVALEMAESLAQLLDEAVRYGADLRRIRHLVPEGFSAHWQHSAEFLAIVGEHWPRIVASLGMCSVQQAQSDALSRLALAWEEHPPAFPIISAGSTGSQPLTLRLLHSIANAPRGVVILPTLGCDIDAQEDVAITQTHPLAHVAASAQFLGYRLSDLPVLTSTTSTANAQWMAQIFSIASSGVTSVPMPESLIPICCRDEWEEARVIGLILREGLQSSTVRMIVVSPDRATLARVATILTRSNITADVTAFKRLSDHPLVSWWRLLLALVSSHAGAIESLAFLQHAVSFAHDDALRDACVRAVDEHYARGLAKTRGMDGLTYALRQASVPSEHSNTMETAIRALEQLFACEKSQVPIAEWLSTLLLCAESWGQGRVLMRCYFP